MGKENVVCIKLSFYLLRFISENNSLSSHTTLSYYRSSKLSLVAFSKTYLLSAQNR